MIFVNFWQNAPIPRISSIKKHVFTFATHQIADWVCPKQPSRLNNNSLQFSENMYWTGAFALIQTTRFFFFPDVVVAFAVSFIRSFIVVVVVVVFVIVVVVVLLFFSFFFLFYFFFRCALVWSLDISFVRSFARFIFFFHSNSFNQIVVVFVNRLCTAYIWIC